MTEIPDGPDGFRAVPIPHLARRGSWRVEAMRAMSRARLLWFTKGQGRITISGVTRGYGPNNVVFLPPRTMHGFEINPRVFGTSIDFPLNFDGRFLEDPVHLRLRDVSAQAELATLVDRFQAELSADRPLRDRALAAHAELILTWLERMAGGEADDPVSVGSARRLAIAYAALVERDYVADKSIADFAAELGVTPTHLSRACRAAGGRSAHKVLSDRVMAEARRLLADTNLPVNNVAGRLGFSSPAYFTRAFQRRTGLTPTAFRQSA
ncbi:MAG: AraC family transcriptional regulator [Pseudomonadota bacterium]